MCYGSQSKVLDEIREFKRRQKFYRNYLVVNEPELQIRPVIVNKNVQTLT